MEETICIFENGYSAAKKMTGMNILTSSKQMNYLKISRMIYFFMRLGDLFLARKIPKKENKSSLNNGEES